MSGKRAKTLEGQLREVSVDLRQARESLEEDQQSITVALENDTAWSGQHARLVREANERYID